jgi:hypothetical protein
MLEAELHSEKGVLEKRAIELKVKVEELKQVEDRLRHVEALLGYRQGGDEAVYAINAPALRRSNWAKLCRDNGLLVGRNSGHRVLIRHKPEIHASIAHTCLYK